MTGGIRAADGCLFPAFPVTGKLKAHGNSEACFELSGPRSPARGPRGSFLLSAGVHADGRWPRQARLAGEERRGLSGSGTPAGPREGHGQGSSRPWQRDCVPVQCFRPKINGAAATGLLEAAAQFVFVRRKPSGWRAGCLGRAQGWGKVRVLSGPLCTPGHPHPPGKSIGQQGVVWQAGLSGRCVLSISVRRGGCSCGEGCPSEELGFPGHTATDRGQCPCHACICRVQGGYLSRRLRQGLQANQGSPGHRELERGPGMCP